MYRIDGRLKGVGTVLFNAPTTKARAGKLREEELLEEATRRVYRDASGTLVLPAWNLLRCLMDGARLGNVKHGRKSIVPYVQALVIVDGDPSFDRQDYDGLDMRYGRIPPRTGAMVMLYRPKLDPGWLLRFRLIVADTTLPPDTIQQVIDFAGLLAGLGAFRPVYGRFVLDAFDVESATAKKKTQALPIQA